MCWCRWRRPLNGSLVFCHSYAFLYSLYAFAAGAQPERGGIGLGLAEPELSIQYIVNGGAASDHKGFFDVGDELVAVDGACVSGMRLKAVSELIIGDEGTDVEITIIKAITRERKSIVLTRRGAGKKMPPKKPAPPPPEPVRPAKPIKVATPTFDPPDGHTFPHGASFLTHTVSIGCDTQSLHDVQIRYTLDGTLPAARPPVGLLYGGGGIRVREAVTITAVALVSDEASPGGWSASQVASASYSFERAAPKTPSPPCSPTPPAPPSAEEMQAEEIQSPVVERAVTPDALEPEPLAADQESLTEKEPQESTAEVGEPERAEAAACETHEAEADEIAQTRLEEAETEPALEPVEEVEQEEEKPQAAAVRQRLPSAGRARPGLYSNVTSRLHKTTASVRAKDVSMARNPYFGSRAGQLPPNRNLRPSTSTRRAVWVEDGKVAAAPAVEQSRDVEALVSPNARMRPNKALHHSSGTVVGALPAGRRSSMAASCVRDAGKEYRPRSSCEGDACDTGGSTAARARTSHPQAPGASTSAKVLLASSPLARRKGWAAGSIWKSTVFLAEREREKEGEREGETAAASLRGSEGAEADTADVSGESGGHATGEGENLDFEEAPSSRGGDTFARRSKQGCAGSFAGGSSRGGGARGEWLVLGDQRDLSYPLSLSPLGAAAAASMSPTLRSSPARGSPHGASQCTLPRGWTKRTDTASLLGSHPPAPGQAGMANALGLSHGVGTGWKQVAGQNARAATSLVRSNSTDLLLKLERPRAGFGGVGSAAGGFGAKSFSTGDIRRLPPAPLSPLRSLHKR